MTSANLKTNSSDIVATLRDVTMTYDGYQTRALARVDLEFRRGEVVAVLGVKGAGKSTVLKILAGRLRPTEGTVKVFGRSPRHGSKARVGYLPGKAQTNRSTGFFGRFFGRKNESPSATRDAGHLAQAMVGNRDLLVLDDPFESLNLAEISEVKALIEDMIGRGKTVVLSSASLMAVKDLCQRFVIIDEGKIQASGTLAELLSAGGAIRFLPAVLPRDIVERVLSTLRDEIVGQSAPAQASVSVSKINLASPEKETTGTPCVDQLLHPLTKSKPVEDKAPAPTAPQKHDPIDHGKLDGLTKPK